VAGLVYIDAKYGGEYKHVQLRCMIPSDQIISLRSNPRQDLSPRLPSHCSGSNANNWISCHTLITTHAWKCHTSVACVHVRKIVTSLAAVCLWYNDMDALDKNQGYM